MAPNHAPPQVARTAPQIRRWVRLGVAPEPVLAGRIGASWPVMRSDAEHRERSAHLRMGAARDSVLTALGMGVFEKIIRLVADAGDEALNGAQMQAVLPLALACRAHYAHVRMVSRTLLLCTRGCGGVLRTGVIGDALLAYVRIDAVHLVGPLESPLRAMVLLGRVARDVQTVQLGLCMGLTSGSLRALRMCSRLRAVHLAECGELAPLLGDELAALPMLRDVRVSGCIGTTELFFIRLLRAPALDSVDINGGLSFSDAVPIAISQSPSASTLRRIFLSPCFSVSDHALQQLVRSTRNLGELGIGRTWIISYDVLRAIGDYATQLYCLHIRGSFLLPWNFGVRVAQLKSLQRLEIEGGYFRDSHLALLVEGCRAIEYFQLRQCQEVTDVGVAQICGLPMLAELDIVQCRRITDAMVPHIKKAANAPLQFLRLIANLLISEQACRELETCCVRILHPYQQRIELTSTATTSVNLVEELWGEPHN